MILPSFIFGIIFACVCWFILLFIFWTLTRKKSKPKIPKVVTIPSFRSVFDNSTEDPNSFYKAYALEFYSELVWQIKHSAHTSVESIVVKL